MRLKELREQRCLSQQDLADAAALSKTTINALEHGRRAPQPRTLRRLAAALRVEPVELLDRVNIDGVLPASMRGDQHLLAVTVKDAE